MSPVRRTIPCPSCGGEITVYRNPVPTVDILIELTQGPDAGKLVLIERRNPPLGWAIPGGFVDYGESVEQAAVREAQEETSLEVELLELLGVYSDPRRDPRMHTLSVAFCARSAGEPRAADDARGVGLFGLEEIPAPLCFDHAAIVADYVRWRRRR
jgi:8-oxo-dGTP diphosphatase